MTERGLGPCDLLTIEQACRVLRMSDRDGRAFLEQRRLVKLYAGRPRIVAGELVRAHDDADQEQEPVRQVGPPLRRVSLVGK
jgi:hypothetical protein